MPTWSTNFNCRAGRWAPRGSRLGAWRSTGLALTVEPLAWSPVLLEAPDGRGESRFPRAMARVPRRRGPRGTGWIEFNQPPR